MSHEMLDNLKELSKTYTPKEGSVLVDDSIEMVTFRFRRDFGTWAYFYELGMKEERKRCSEIVKAAAKSWPPYADSDAVRDLASEMEGEE